MTITAAKLFPSRVPSRATPITPATSFDDHLITEEPNVGVDFTVASLVDPCARWRVEVILRKLRLSGSLSSQEEAALTAALQPPCAYAKGEDLVSDGESPGAVRAIVSGFACRYKMLENGRRQIMALLVPGDFCDLQIAVLRRMDHAIGALTRCTVVHLAHADVERLSAFPGLRRAFWWSSLVDEAVLRQALVGMGQRTADKQMAHVFCELEARLAPLDLVRDGAFSFPLSQEELGDVLGLSSVHTNRVLQRLRELDLLDFKGRQISIPDLDRLRRFSGFSAAYLHRDNAVLTHVTEGA